MKFKTIKKTKSGFIIGKVYKGDGDYSDYLWKVLGEERDYVRSISVKMGANRLCPINSEALVCFNHIKRD